MTEEKFATNQERDLSCDPTLTRKEFIKKVVKGAAVTGGLLAAPKVIDSFIAPAFAAGCSTCSTADTGAGLSDVQSGAGNCGGTDVISLATNDTCGQTGGT